MGSILLGTKGSLCRPCASSRLVRAWTVTISGRQGLFFRDCDKLRCQAFFSPLLPFSLQRWGAQDQQAAAELLLKLKHSASRFTGLEGFIVISVQRTTQKAPFPSWPRALWSSAAVAKAESLSPGISWEGWCSPLSSRKIMLLKVAAGEPFWCSG